ncbi:MAG TPA: 50S ribosomal protein L33 [Candidatus Pacearchaeota archaeon]|nr:50S ribosomal protein L33 [Candidatus Pacearchaeota archaeon]HOK94442.1 50S ribosomal protein L33 [Candidatus Pacearchaeota archaeon]HPO75504.1 50S ribosomal protein L33 [Candidatus Pacearchaeota archaeon]
MAKKKQKLIKLQCQDCKKINYFTYKNSISVERKLEFKKFCPSCKKHTVHKEAKR